MRAALRVLDHRDECDVQTLTQRLELGREAPWDMKRDPLVDAREDELGLRGGGFRGCLRCGSALEIAFDFEQRCGRGLHGGGSKERTGMVR